MCDYEQMNQIAAYGGFPQRYPHWRFGMEYESLRKRHHYGLGRIYEMVINNDPCLRLSTGIQRDVDQKLVIAHVYGHCDFFKNNLWFAQTNRKMMDEMANHSTRVRRHIEKARLRRGRKISRRLPLRGAPHRCHSMFPQPRPHRHGPRRATSRRAAVHPLSRQGLHGSLDQSKGSPRKPRPKKSRRQSEKEHATPARPPVTSSSISYSMRAWKIADRLPLHRPRGKLLFRANRP